MIEPYKFRIAKSSALKKSKIIISIDPSNVEINDLNNYVIDLINKIGDYVCAIKLNFHVILPLSTQNLQEINKTAHYFGLQSIADIKLNDIDNTNQIAIDHLFKMDFDAVTANPFIGKNALKSLVEYSHNHNFGVISLGYMSHPEASETYGARITSDMQSVEPMYSIFIDNSVQANSDGVVIGATRSEIIKLALDSRIAVYSPGIGYQGGDLHQAVRNGADYFIIGRSIINSIEPLETVKSMCSTINQYKSK